MKAPGLVRTILRYAYRGRVIARRLPREFGSPLVYVAPESQLKYLKPGVAGLDPMLLKWARRFVSAGDAVWDIGANAGIFALAAAGLGADVLAVEPDPFLANALLKTRAMNPGLKLSVMAGAVSDTSGLATLEISSGGRAANSLSEFAGERSVFGHALAEVIVPTLRLDDLLSVSTPKFVKIDVEGAELAALMGGKRLLSEVRPIFAIEVGEVHVEAVTRLFVKAHYQLLDAETMEPIAKAAFNTIAIPSPTAA